MFLADYRSQKHDKILLLSTVKIYYQMKICRITYNRLQYIYTIISFSFVLLCCAFRYHPLLQKGMLVSCISHVFFYQNIVMEPNKLLLWAVKKYSPVWPFHHFPNKLGENKFKTSVWIKVWKTKKREEILKNDSKEEHAP